MLSQAQTSVVPRLVEFSGTVKDAQGTRAPTGWESLSLFTRRTERRASWLETQTVQADAQGHYTVSLGATSANGVPQELFISGEARWLGYNRKVSRSSRVYCC